MKGERMKISKKIIAMLFSVATIVFAAVSINASVIYKDINSISIRTNFTMDYESIKNDGVPDITYSNSGDEGSMVFVYSTAKYEIESCEWYSQGTDEFEIGGAPKVVVYLVTKEYENTSSNDNEYYYRFLSSYSNSTCFISKGTFVSATRLSTSNLKVVFSLQPLKGKFNAPENPYWEDERGYARWDSPNVCDSGYYDLVLYRNQGVIGRVDRYKGNSYNFASYFTKEGDYSFKVRTVAGTDKQAAYGKASEYADSGSINVSQDIIQQIMSGAGAINSGGQSGSGTANVGWIQMNGSWYFYRPDGQQVRNGWVQWQNNWYYLDETGAMKVGQVTVNNRQYYLGSGGAMVTGWVTINGSYYYYDTTAGDNYGAMLVNSWIKYDGKYFYFDENGIMVTGWKQIGDGTGQTAFYYFYPKGTTQGLYGYMATNTTINGFSIGADGRWVQR